ncbi:serine hydrolase [Streptomyces agglomeratus]|uniref:Serine hydrolase n=1 Tax=Streptomyces agglomeratus TaxID=285458 RepID=A0A1E5P917_9ACTN|nr:serine hydrolase domain-containing protein [Streptomyces agglomeratus]OEJ26053.1 serine hydrolase [Streptomyces agglomeratus]OEJ39891.1 serine hydrolase [Streptomyces agglomeratus]OEJ45730.1 serine hydrolase [Streptomyces agglomeratus]OEJ52440.1 serine hydrolase [Streptomyces agglomeratus]OEJ59811.1 serine hydrolase [Streptomyces agglomeratus]
MTSPFEDLLPSTQRALLHRIATAQAEGRAPSLVAAVQRDGRTVWTGSRTCVEGHGPDPGTQYRIGSITKTFTAVLVMRLRDEGLLDLGDPLDKHLPGTGVGSEVTVAQLLAHTAGLAAETPAPWWERTPGTSRPGLGDVLGDQARMHPAGRTHHYSNPGYTLLGRLVEAVRGEPWGEVLRREVLGPLDLGRTSEQPQAPHAGGWAVHPWADVMLPEPSVDLGLMAPAGQLWSTTADLCRFAAFLAEGHDKVLGAESVREMRTPAAPASPGDPFGAYGLGLQIVQSGGRTLVGHTGSLPGFVAGLWVSVEDGVAAVALANATSGLSAPAVAADLIRIVVEAEPRIPEPWRPLPGAEVDRELLALTGPWFWGTSAYALTLVAGGGVELQPLRGNGRGSRFTARADGTWLGLDGYYLGETLRVVRREGGAVSHLDLGSFVFTREPYAPEDAIPGGVDEGGWRGL